MAMAERSRKSPKTKAAAGSSTMLLQQDEEDVEDLSDVLTEATRSAAFLRNRHDDHHHFRFFLLLLLLSLGGKSVGAQNSYGSRSRSLNNPPPPPPPPRGHHTPPPPANAPPIILEHPSSKIAASEEPVLLSCHASGQPTPRIEWWFSRNGILGVPTPVDTVTKDPKLHRMQLPDGSLFFLRTNEDQDAGTYWCLARNENGVAQSRNATINIAYLEHVFPSDIRPPFLASTNSDSVSNPLFEGVSGTPLELPCTPPRGNPAPAVRWKKDGRILDPVKTADARSHVHRIIINSAGHLLIRSLDPEQDEGEYSCLARNLAGSRESNPVHVRVLRPPVFTSRPQNTSILAGRDARIECVADGKPKPDIYWTFENHPVSTDRIDEGPASSSVTQTKSTLTLSRVRPSQSGVYVCKAISSIGKIYAKAELYVQVPAVIDEPPRSRVRVRPGNGATLHCGASGRPKPLVLWMHEEERTFLSPGDRTDTIEVSNDEDQLIIRAAYEEMNFVCVAANAVGADIARIKLIVSEGGENEIIEEAPEVGVISATGDNSLSSVRRMPIKGGIRMTNVTGVSPSSIRISWMLEMAEDVQRIDGFYILYRRADGRADGGLELASGFTSITVLHAAATSYAVNRLQPYTKYAFLVIPFQRGRSGRPSALHTAFTSEIKPTHAPTHLGWSQLNDSSVRIGWNPLHIDKFKGVPLGYRVLILQHGHVASNLTVAFDDSNIVLSNLEPRHVYEVQVAAFNGEGLGPFSQPLEVRPEPSLALTAGAMAAEDLNDSSSDSSSSLLWIIPVIIALIILALLFFSAVILVRRSKNHHQQSHHFSSGNPLFSLGRKSNKNSSSHFQAAERKDFQLIPTSATSGTGTRRKKMTSSSSAILFSSSSQGIHQNLSSTLSEDIAEEGEEDSSCIDRSTHSITGGFLRRKGGVNKEDDPLEIEAEDAMRRRLLNLSPYATTHLVQGNNPKRRNFNHNPQTNQLPHHRHSHVIQQQHELVGQPLCVNNYLVHSYDRMQAKSIQGSSDHIYAIVATPETKRGEMLSSANSLILVPAKKKTVESQTGVASCNKTTTTLVDILPPPPLYPPPMSGPTDASALSDLYSKVTHKTKKTTNSQSQTNPTHSNSTGRRKKNKHKTRSNPTTPSKAGKVDWKSMDDADDSDSDAHNNNNENREEEEESLLAGKQNNAESSYESDLDFHPPDVIISPMSGATLGENKKKRERSLPRRKTRSQRDQQRKRSLTSAPTTPSHQPANGATGFLSKLDPDEADALLSQSRLESAKAVKKAMANTRNND